MTNKAFEEEFLKLRASFVLELARDGKMQAVQSHESKFSKTIFCYLLGISRGIGPDPFDNTPANMLELHKFCSKPFWSEEARGLTGFHIACRDHPIGGIKFLLACSSSNQQNLVNMEEIGCGASALHFACLRQEDPSEVISLLLAAKANPNARIFKNAPNSIMGSGTTFANVKRDTLDRCMSQSSVLMWASLASSSSAVKALLNAKANVNDFDFEGSTALHVAAEFENTDVCRLLLICGASVTLKNKVGRIALHYATSEGDEAMVLAMLKAGADVEARDIEGETPLFTAASGNNMVAAKCLISMSGAGCITTKNERKQTPLHVAASLGSDAVAKVLVKVAFDKFEGKPVYERDCNGESCLGVLIRKLPCVAAKVLDRLKIVRGHWDGCDQISYTFSDLNDIPAVISHQTALEVAVDCGEKTLLGHSTMQTLLEQKWKLFGKKLFLRQICLYFILLFFFTSYVMMWREIANEPLPAASNSTEIAPASSLRIFAQRDIDLSILSGYVGSKMMMFDIWQTILLVLLCAHSYFEGIELVVQGCKKIVFNKLPFPKYLCRWWGILSVITVASVLASLSLVRSAAERTGFAAINSVLNVVSQPETTAIASLLLWIRLLKMLGVMKVLGPFVRMVFIMIGDVAIFCSIFLVFLFGFATAFLSLFSNVEGFHTMTDALITLFNLMLGQTDFAVFQNTGSAVGIGLYMIYMVIVTILLVNLLIAAMSNSFSTVHDDAENEWRLERASCIVRIERTLSKKVRAKYYEAMKKVDVSTPPAQMHHDHDDGEKGEEEEEDHHDDGEHEDKDHSVSTDPIHLSDESIKKIAQAVMKSVQSTWQ